MDLHGAHSANIKTQFNDIYPTTDVQDFKLLPCGSVLEV
jgi:hypothetical protein